MAIRYNNAADDAAYEKNKYEMMQSLLKRGADFIKSGKNPFSMLFDDSEVELKSEYASIGDLLKTWSWAGRKVKGDASIVFGDQKSDVNLKPIDFSIDDDSLVIHLDIDNERDVTVKDFVQQVKSQLAKLYLKDNARFQFNFRGNVLDIERVVLIKHDDDDDATFLVEFTNSQVSSKKREVKAAATAEDLLQQIDVFFNENTSLPKNRRNAVKVVGLVNDSSKQQTFQISYPQKHGDQIVFNLMKCPAWRFKEIVNDPETMTVSKFQDYVEQMHSKNGYVFMKAKDQTYGVAGIDMLQSGSSLNDEGQHVMVALLLKPWSELFESRHILRKTIKMKKRHTRKQICEAIAYWQKQLRAGNYKKLNEETSKELNRQQAADDEDQLANVEETRVGEHFLKFIKAVRDKNITGDYVRNDNKKKYNPEQAIGAALAMIALGFTYRSESVGGGNKEFYAKCFNNLVQEIRRQDYSAARSLVYIVDHLTEFDAEYYEQRFSTMVDPEVYE